MADVREVPPEAPVPHRRLRRLAWTLVASGALAAAGTEAFLRVCYGLGDPPVIVSDTRTEYRAKPDGHYRRLGNRIDYNAFSMRSDPIVTPKPAGERRVLVFGDSVINGGANTDQVQLATHLLRDRILADGLAPSGATVCNISAGSWGPQNLLGYVREFGLFDADAVVIVVSSHDAFDEVTAWPARSGDESPTYRTALGEAWDRLSPRVRARFLPAASAASPAARPDDPPPNPRGNPAPCLAAFGELLDRIRSSGITPIVAFHFERPELDATSEPEGHRLLRDVCAARGIEPISLAPALRAALEAGNDPYRDRIHPNAFGQQAIAEALMAAVEPALRGPATTRPTRRGLGQKSGR
jgi:hypothetical protein